MWHEYSRIVAARLLKQQRQAVQVPQLAPDLAPLRCRAHVQLAQQHLRQKRDLGQRPSTARVSRALLRHSAVKISGAGLDMQEESAEGQMQPAQYRKEDVYMEGVRKCNGGGKSSTECCRSLIPSSLFMTTACAYPEVGGRSSALLGALRCLHLCQRRPVRLKHPAALRLRHRLLRMYR